MLKLTVFTILASLAAAQVIPINAPPVNPSRSEYGWQPSPTTTVVQPVTNQPSSNLPTNLPSFNQPSTFPVNPPATLPVISQPSYNMPSNLPSFAQPINQPMNPNNPNPPIMSPPVSSLNPLNPVPTPAHGSALPAGYLAVMDLHSRSPANSDYIVVGLPTPPETICSADNFNQMAYITNEGKLGFRFASANPLPHGVDVHLTVIGSRQELSRRLNPSYTSNGATVYETVFDEVKLQNGADVDYFFTNINTCNSPVYKYVLGVTLRETIRAAIMRDRRSY